MVSCAPFLLICFLTIVAAQEQQQQQAQQQQEQQQFQQQQKQLQQQQFQRPPSAAVSGTTTGFTVGKQYNVDAKVLKDGTTSGSIYASLGGQVGPGPTYYTGNSGPEVSLRDGANGGYYQYSDAGALSQAPSSSLWSPSNVNYYVAGGVFVVILVGYGLYAYFTTPSVLKKIAAEVTGNDEDEEESGVAGVIPEGKKDTKVASKKSRRRRAIRRDEDAARFASIVLSAIESGECLQKSICLMGSQIGGTEKGKLALSVMEKLIPKSIQDNHYFLTLQKSLQTGQGTCAKFNCKY